MALNRALAAAVGTAVELLVVDLDLGRVGDEAMRGVGFADGLSGAALHALGLRLETAGRIAAALETNDIPTDARVRGLLVEMRERAAASADELERDDLDRLLVRARAEMLGVVLMFLDNRAALAVV